MRATRCLREDHELIAAVLRCFETALIESRTKGAVEAGVFEPFLEFFVGYADGQHYEKEEQCLFACMKRCGINDADEGVKRLLEEHKMSRQRVELMLSYLDEAVQGKEFAIEKFYESAGKFRDLILGHIPLENGHVFRAGDEQIPDSELPALEAAYEAMDASPENAAVRERCLRLGRELIECWTPKEEEVRTSLL
ncbi:MAG: hemerythrin domain-containing protein [Phycisphaerales bacterium JB038]